MITLGEAYAAASSQGRAALLAAAAYPAGVIDSILTSIYSVLTLGIGIVVVGVVMLRGAFGRATAIVGMVTGAWHRVGRRDGPDRLVPGPRRRRIAAHDRVAAPRGPRPATHAGVNRERVTPSLAPWPAAAPGPGQSGVSGTARTSASHAFARAMCPRAIVVFGAQVSKPWGASGTTSSSTRTPAARRRPHRRRLRRGTARSHRSRSTPGGAPRGRRGGRARRTEARSPPRAPGPGTSASRTGSGGCSTRSG